MEKILEKANELGHLLQQHEIVQRFRDLSGKLERDEASRKLLDEAAEATHRIQELERSGKPIEPEEKQRMEELEQKMKANSMINEFLATQAYYMQMLTQVNEVIGNPTGPPPKESSIILPDDPGPGLVLP